MSNIYVLRHEQRARTEISQYVDLTTQGMYNANFVLAPKLLQMLDFDPIIYCSPYSRTIETIAPYANYKDTYINLEPAISEGYIHKAKDVFNSLINQYYTPVVEYVDEKEPLPKIVDINQHYQHIISNVRKFLTTLKNNGDTYLLVTHLPVINAFLSIVNNEPLNVKNNIETGTLLGPFTL